MKKNLFTIIFLIITIAIAGTAAYLIYHYMNENQTDEGITEIKTLISVGDYGNAQAKIDETLTQNPDSIEANQLKADLAQLQNDFETASQTYQTLYQLTGKNFYQQKALTVSYGNIPTNTLAGAKVIETAYGTFMVTYDSESSGQDNPVYTYNLWHIEEDSKESIFVDQGTQAFITDLQVWGNRLYFRSSSGIKALDLYSGETTDIIIDGTAGGTPSDYTKIENLSIYNGEFYFIQTIVARTYTESNTVSKCDLAGHNVSEVVEYQGLTGQGIVTINQYFPMADRVFYRTTNNTVNAIRVKSATGIGILLESADMGNSFTVNMNDLFVASSVDGASVQVFQINLASTSVTPLANANPVSTRLGLAASDSSLYYFAPDGFTQEDLASQTVAPLRLMLEATTESSEEYITGDKIFVYQFGQFDGTYKTIVSQINQDNLTENTVIFTGNN